MKLCNSDTESTIVISSAVNSLLLEQSEYLSVAFELNRERDEIVL